MKRADPKETILVEIYGKPECHLCDVVKAKLEKIRGSEPVEIREIDITLDDALMAEYGERIPLVFVNGHLVAKYFLDEKAFLKYLQKVKRGKFE